MLVLEGGTIFSTRMRFRVGIKRLAIRDLRRQIRSAKETGREGGRLSHWNLLVLVDFRRAISELMTRVLVGFMTREST